MLCCCSGRPQSAQLRRGFRRPRPGVGRRSCAVGTALGRNRAHRQTLRFPAVRRSVRGLAVPRRDSMWLAASPGLVAVQLRDSSSPSAPARLYVAGPDGGFRRLADDVGEEPFDPLWPPLSVTSQGVFTQEAVPLLPRLTGGRTTSSSARGQRGLRGRRGRRGRGLHRRRADRLRPALGHRAAPSRARGVRRPGASLAISPAGDVAATSAVGDGSDVVLYCAGGRRSRARARARGADGDGQRPRRRGRLCRVRTASTRGARDRARRGVGRAAVPRPR
jgi:hypothetical protein